MERTRAKVQTWQFGLRLKSLTLVLTALVAAAFLAVAAPARAAVVDFEGLPSGTTVIAQYSGQGVTLNNQRLVSYAQPPGFTHSGTKAIELCFAIEFCTAPLRIDFSAGQARAKLWVGFSSPLQQPFTVIMQALDQNGATVAQTSAVLPAGVGAVPAQTALQITSASANIRQVLVMAAPPPSGGDSYNNGIVVDDVEFDTVGGPPVCASGQKPVVTLVKPQSGSIVNANLFVLQGAVSTVEPLETAVLKVYSVATQNEVISDLLSAGSIQQVGGPFGPTGISGSLGPGENRVTVHATSCAGGHEATVFVTYSPIASDAKVKLLRMEVVQATEGDPSVPLVSNKPTIVRAYLSLTGSTASIGELSGAITGAPPAGAAIPPLLRSSNKIILTAGQDSKVSDITSTLNFVLPSEWTDSRTLHFELSKIYVQGLESNVTCDGCRNLDEINAPRYAHFNPTNSVNLVLAPYVYKNGLTPDILFTPMAALQWMNNVYPVRGNFPSDGSGIRLLRILPMSSTSKNLCFNCDDGGDFLDDLNAIHTDLFLEQYGVWPTHFQVLAITPCGCGGRARIGGYAGYADDWNLESGTIVPQGTMESYGAIWAHELGHNFGRKHASNAHGESSGGGVDSGFPNPHGGIGVSGLAITTEWWNGTPFVINPGTAETGQKHAHDLMSYGQTTGDNTNEWISPYTFKALYNRIGLASSAQIAPMQAAREMLVVSGRIQPDGTATFRPFYRVTTRAPSAADESSPYSVELLDATGRSLQSYRVATEEVEGAKYLSFSAFLPWKTGTRKVVLKTKDEVIAERLVSVHVPWVRITSPAPGQGLGGKDKERIAWDAGDEDKDSLTFSVFYSESKGELWIPVAENVSGLETTIDTRLLPGSQDARVKVRVTDGVNTAEAITKRALSVSDKSPMVAILRPRERVRLKAGAMLMIEGGAYDAEDGMLTGRSLVWTSNRNGNLGYGGHLELSKLSPGAHVIALTATDKTGKKATARLSVIVQP
ncbi:MAG: hypothetical protein ABJA62_02350 [Luteimonas sp.]